MQERLNGKFGGKIIKVEFDENKIVLMHSRQVVLPSAEEVKI